MFLQPLLALQERYKDAALGNAQLLPSCCLWLGGGLRWNVAVLFRHNIQPSTIWCSFGGANTEIPVRAVLRYRRHLLKFSTSENRCGWYDVMKWPFAKCGDAEPTPPKYVDAVQTAEGSACPPGITFPIVRPELYSGRGAAGAASSRSATPREHVIVRPELYSGRLASGRTPARGVQLRENSGIFAPLSPQLQCRSK